MQNSAPNNQIVHAIIVAAGKGTRAGQDKPKQFMQIANKPMLRHSAESLLKHPSISKLWIIVADGQKQYALDALNGLDKFVIGQGGSTRQQSVFNGLQMIMDSDDAPNQVLIHDAARPYLPHIVIDRLLEALKSAPGAIPVLPTIDTMIGVENFIVKECIDRRNIWRVQTPQAFRFNEIFTAHQQYREIEGATDDAQLMIAAGHDVSVVAGDEMLKKYTLPSDFSSFEQRPMTVKTGMGLDVHQLVEGEELWLGGVKIEHDKGLSGHSDADVLLHALTDALLGAIGAGDIGDHFPPSDSKWKGAASAQFLAFAGSLVHSQHGKISNIDTTLICEEPKLKPYREKIRLSIANILDISTEQVSVKATTTERLGFTGRGEGIAAQAIATVIF